MLKTFKYKLKPNKSQRITFAQWLGSCRYLYNVALEHRITAWQSGRKSVSEFDQNMELPKCKKLEGFEWLGNVQSQVLQDVIKRVEVSYKNFYRGAGFPKWAKKHSYSSFRFPQITNFRIENNRIRLPKIGWVQLYYHRSIQGKVKQITIVKEINSWNVCVVCEIEPRPFKGEHQALGIDLGVARLATLSTGEHFDNPLFYKSYQDQLRRKQRKLSRQVKQSNSWYKTKHQIRKLHQKVRRCRSYYLHYVSHSITSRYNVVYMEDLKLKGMTRSAKGTLENPGKNVKQKNGLNRSLVDSGLGMLTNMIEYKTLHQLGAFHRVPAHYTSQTCPECGHTDKDNRKSQADFKCTCCSFAANADQVAAKNILSSGAELWPLTWEVAPSVGLEAPSITA